MAYEPVLAALSDPTRRAIVEALRYAPQPVGRIADRLPVSRPAVSQHLRVLSDAGLVTAEQHGAARIYRLAPRGFSDLRAWLDSMWDDALAAYVQEAQRTAMEDRT